MSAHAAPSHDAPAAPGGMDDTLHVAIRHSADRLFGEQVDGVLHAAVERGEWPQRLWQAVTEAGFGTALARTAHAGIEAGWRDAWPILHGIGSWQVPLPLAETMIGTMLLSMAGIEPPPGPLTLVAQDLDRRLAFEDATDGTILHGRASRVPWARHCRWALVSLHGPEPGTLCLVDLQQQGQVRIEAGANLAGEPRDELAFAGARCALRFDNPLPALREPVSFLGALVRSAAIAGALESALAQSVRYAQERVQFGRPIGAFQAIQHALAVLAGETAAARTAALVAAGSAPSIAAGDPASAGFDIAVAKLRCGEAATRGAPIAHQVHGAIGFTREHPLHRTTCRLWAWRAEYGADVQWADRLGAAAIAAGSTGFWPALTRRGFEGR
jgi:acyl-CoA dehydrogenase